MPDKEINLGTYEIDPENPVEMKELTKIILSLSKGQPKFTTSLRKADR